MISKTVLPILTKYGMLMHLGPLHHVSENKISRLKKNHGRQPPFENKASPFIPFKIVYKRRMINTEIGNRTNTNTKNNSSSVRYRVALFA